MKVLTLTFKTKMIDIKKCFILLFLICLFVCLFVCFFVCFFTLSIVVYLFCDQNFNQKSKIGYSTDQIKTKISTQVSQNNTNSIGHKSEKILKNVFPVDTGRKLNVHKTFRRRPGRLLNVLCTFNLRFVSTGLYQSIRFIPMMKHPL